MGNITYNDAIFRRILKDYLKYADENRIRTGDLDVKKVWDFYEKRKDLYANEILQSTKGARDRISRATFYNKEELKKTIRDYNETKEQWISDSIIENDKYIYVEFNWKEYFEKNANRKPENVYREIGEIINGHRDEIRKLISANRNAQNESRDFAKENKALKKQLDEMIKSAEKEERTINRLQRTDQELSREVEDLKLKLESITKYLSEEEKKYAMVEYNKQRAIDTVPDTYQRRHSYMGEKDGTTPPINEIRRRFETTESKEEEPEKTDKERFDADKYKDLFQ